MKSVDLFRAITIILGILSTMLIGLCGGLDTLFGHLHCSLLLSGICSGKQTVAQYLTANHGFVLLHLAKLEDGTSSNNKRSWQADKAGSRNRETGITTFANVETLVNFVTGHWKERWVTTDIWDDSVLRHLLRRPAFILIGVDAPVSVRWHRQKERYVSLILVLA